MSKFSHPCFKETFQAKFQPDIIGNLGPLFSKINFDQICCCFFFGGGILSKGSYGTGVFVWRVLSGGLCPVGFCPTT